MRGWEAGRLGRLGGWEAGRLEGWKTGGEGREDWEAGRLRGWVGGEQVGEVPFAVHRE
jgi:hypothetical protein